MNRQQIEPDLTGPISSELYKTFRKFGADAGVLSIVGSWRDTMPDSWVLESLRWWNGRKLPLRERLYYAWRVLRQKPEPVRELDPALVATLERLGRIDDVETRGVHLDPNEKRMGGTKG